MHELSVTQAILDTALRYAERGGARKINALHLRVGALSGIVADSVRFYFDFVSKDTMAENAQLHIEITPPRARCRACGAERVLSTDGGPAGVWFEQMQALGPCACGQETYELSGGFDCFLESLDVE